MKIDSISLQIPELTNPLKAGKGANDKFQNILTDFIGSVNQDQLNSNEVTKEFVQGGNVQIQDVMIAGEKAKTSLELLMEIRNKAIDTYNELTNMQI